MDENDIPDDKISKKKRIEAARRIVSTDEKPVEWKEIEKLIARGHTG
jgi:hypothetical protein